MVKQRFEEFAKQQRLRVRVKAFKRWLLLVSLLVSLLVGLASLVFVGVKWVIPGGLFLLRAIAANLNDFEKALKIVQAGTSAFGTAATIVGGVVLYLNFRVANKNVAIANRTAELTESRLVTERFSKAVEQLGSDKIEVRLGGIYALERIAQDSKRDHWTIMEVLTAFVREKSPVAADTKPQVKRSFVEQALQPKASESEPASVTQDVQAALTVIGRRKAEQDPGLLDLTDSHLSGAKLNKVNLEGAKLNGTKLKNAHLMKANLSRAFLNGADFSAAFLIKADLEGANFSSANLTGANLSFANLTNARGLTDEQIEVAYLCYTTLPNGTKSNRDCARLGITLRTEESSQSPTPDPTTASEAPGASETAPATEAATAPDPTPSPPNSSPLP